MSTQTASPYISQLFIYPIKSCAGISVSILKFDHRGPRLDRNWMLVDASTGVFLSQREVPRMALISTTIECGRVWAGFGNDKKLMELPTEGRLIDVSIWEDVLPEMCLKNLFIGGSRHENDDRTSHA